MSNAPQYMWRYKIGLEVLVPALGFAVICLSVMVSQPKTGLVDQTPDSDFLKPRD
jgi:hypothetical protein